MNKQLARLLAANFLSALADRLAQIQLLSIVVLAGPDGEGFGNNTMALVLPFVLFSLPLALLADRLDNRRFLIALALLRSLLILSVPTMLLWQAPPGKTIAMCLFSLSALIATSLSPFFATIYRSSKSVLKASALALLADLAASALIICSFAGLSDMYLPQQTLRICAALYLFSMFMWWSTNTDTSVHPAQKKPARSQSLFEFYRSHKLVFGSFRLICLADAANTVCIGVLLVLCIQNTQLAGENIAKVFFAIASGFAYGAVFCALRKISKKWIVTSAICNLALYLSFLAYSLHEVMPTLLTVTGFFNCCLVLRTHSLAQQLVPSRLRSQMNGLRVGICLLVVLVSALVVEQLSERFSGLTIVRVLCSEAASLSILVFLSRQSLTKYLTLFTPGHKLTGATSGVKK